MIIFNNRIIKIKLLVSIKKLIIMEIKNFNTIIKISNSNSKFNKLIKKVKKIKKL